MPIRNTDHMVIGVAQAVNKLTARDVSFDEHDEKVSDPYDLASPARASLMINR